MVVVNDTAPLYKPFTAMRTIICLIFIILALIAFSCILDMFSRVP